MIDTIQNFFEQKELYHKLTKRVETLEALLEAKQKQDHSTSKETSSSSTPSNSPVDFSKIKGIGKVIAGKLVIHGFHNFEQIAELTDEEIPSLEEKLGLFPGKIERDNWRGQAEKLSD